MNRRWVTSGVAATVFAAGFATSVLPAGAELRTLTVTLLGGETRVVSVDVPPGTPLSAISIPGIDKPIIGISEVPGGAPPAPPAVTSTSTAPAATTATTATTPTATTPADEEEADPDAPVAADDDGPGRRQQDRQRTTRGERGEGDRDRDGRDDESDESERGDGERERGSKEDEREDADPARDRPRPERNDDGSPTSANPTFSVAEPGPAPIGVPNFFIEKFRIPPFLLPIYQAAGIEYGIRWEVLAAINEIETDYGRNLNVSTAGALGWMQFMPATWKAYGTDANGDGKKDPYNPVDAIFAAARYLKAADYDQSVRKAIFAYNHANWYVDSVLLRARLIGGLPADFVGSLTGLTQGRFPVAAKATYASDLDEKAATRRVQRGRNAAVPVESDERRESIRIYADEGSPVVAVQDGEVVALGENDELGRYVKLRDGFGNTYTYAGLGKVAERHPVPKEEAEDEDAREVVRVESDAKDPKPTRAASAGRQVDPQPERPRAQDVVRKAPEKVARSRARSLAGKVRMFAHPEREAAQEAGGREQMLRTGAPLATDEEVKDYVVGPFGLDRDDVELRRLRKGSKVVGGTILGRIGAKTEQRAAGVDFAIRPAGKDSPQIDPKPILDGWKLLESTAVYRAKGKNPLFGPDAKTASVGQLLLMSKEQLQRRVLRNPRVDVYRCGRRDIRAGVTDRRVLASLEFLAANGLRPTVTSLTCGHSYLTKSGNVSHHSTGTAVDIARVNGIPVMGHQGKGSITDITIRRLLTLQGQMKPDQIISLMTYPNADNTLALSDHDDHIHVGWRPTLTRKDARKFESALKPGQWIKLIDRLGDIDNPTVSLRPSRYAVTVQPPKRASRAHGGE